MMKKTKIKLHTPYFEKDEPGDHNRIRKTGSCLVRYLIIISAILFVLWGTAQIVFKILLRP